MKSTPSDHLARPTRRACPFSNCRLNVSCNYDILKHTNLKLVFRCVKNIKSPLNALVII